MTDDYEGLRQAAESISSFGPEAYSKILEAIEFHHNEDPSAGAEYLQSAEKIMDGYLIGGYLTAENRRRTGVAKGVFARYRADWLRQIEAEG